MVPAEPASSASQYTAPAPADTISHTGSKKTNLAEPANPLLYNVVPPLDSEGNPVAIADFAESSRLLTKLRHELPTILNKKEAKKTKADQRSNIVKIAELHDLLNEQSNAYMNVIEAVIKSETPEKISKLLKTMPNKLQEHSEKIATSITQLNELPPTAKAKMTAGRLAQLTMSQMHTICFMYNHTEQYQFHETFIKSRERLEEAHRSGDKKSIETLKKILTKVVIESQSLPGRQAIWRTFEAYHAYNEALKLPIVNRINPNVQKAYKENLARRYIGEIENLHYQLSIPEGTEEVFSGTGFAPIFDNDVRAKKYVETAEVATIDSAKFKAPEFKETSDISHKIKSLRTSESAAEHFCNEINKLEGFAFNKRSALMMILWNSKTTLPFREQMNSWAEHMDNISSAYAQEREFAKGHLENPPLFDDEERPDEDRARIQELLQELTHKENIYSLIGKRLHDYADQFCRPTPASTEPSQWLSPHLNMLAHQAQARVVKPSQSSITLKKIYTADSLDPTQTRSVPKSTSLLTKEALQDLSNRTDILIEQADSIYGSNEKPGEWRHESTPFFGSMSIKSMRDKYRSALHNLDKIAESSSEGSNKINPEIQEKTNKCWERQLVSQALLEDKRSESLDQTKADELMSAGLAGFGRSNKGPEIIQWENIDPKTGNKISHPMVEIQFTCEPIKLPLDSKNSISYSVPPSYLHIHFKPGTNLHSLNEITPEMSGLVTSSHMKIESYRDVGRHKAAKLGFRYVPKMQVPAEWAVRMATSVAKIPDAPT